MGPILKHAAINIHMIMKVMALGFCFVFTAT